jgi:hypothetical protein
VDTADNEPNQDPTGTEAGDDAMKTMAWTPIAVILLLQIHYNHAGICSHDDNFRTVRLKLNNFNRQRCETINELTINFARACA